MDEEGEGDGLASRLARLWAAGDRTGFYRLLSAEAFPKLRDSVEHGLRLQKSDAEDCVGRAVEAFLHRQDLSDIADPYSYLKRSAWNSGVTLHRERRREIVREVEALSSPHTMDGADALVQAAVDIPGPWAVVAVEEALVDIDAEESWAVIVVEAALARLTPSQGRLVAYLSGLEFDLERKDFDSQSSTAAAALGMSAPAFRKAKQRAYEALAVAIPDVVRELGIQPPARFVAAFEEKRGAFMADDEGA